MGSRLLFEGLLDVKVPRGSNDRKLWKVWRKQWLIFCTVCSGKGEPLLQLQFAMKKCNAPDNEIRIRRDGLSIVRGRSKSRPYRTWAIVAGFKPLLFFAAESEAKAQDWIRSLRNGLWPPSFSFQMLAASSFEVSLIDDENTYQSGLLGVYGHLVLTSFSTISLMHPHWGSTLLQILLTDVQNVLLVREDDMSPAGVFGIILKRVAGNSHLKKLYFYCNQVNDAIQWLLSKWIMKDIDKNNDLNGITANNTQVEDAIYENLDAEPFSSKQRTSSKVSFDFKCITNKSENLDARTNRIEYHSPNSHTYKDKDKRKSMKIKKYDTHEIFNHQPLQFGHDLTEKQSHANIYSNLLAPTANRERETNYHPMLEANSSNNNEKGDFLDPKSSSKDIILADYAVVSKLNKKGDYSITSRTAESELKCEQIVNSKHALGLKPKILSLSRQQNHEELIKNSPVVFISEVNPLSENKLDFSDKPQDLTEREVNNSTGKNSQPIFSHTLACEKQDDKTLLDFQATGMLSLINTTPTNESKDWNEDLLISHQCSDASKTNFTAPTSFETGHLTLKNKDRNSKLELNVEDWDDDQEFTSHIYEHLMERKGTIYEEIDDDEDQEVTVIAPELPERSSNLETSSSFQLFKLSKNINKVLEEMTEPISPHKHMPFPKLVKKIKETSRIMHI